MSRSPNNSSMCFRSRSRRFLAARLDVRFPLVQITCIRRYPTRLARPALIAFKLCFEFGLQALCLCLALAVKTAFGRALVLLGFRVVTQRKVTVPTAWLYFFKITVAAYFKRHRHDSSLHSGNRGYPDPFVWGQGTPDSPQSTIYGENCGEKFFELEFH